MVSGYVRYLVPYVVEFNQPQEQTRKLKQICEKFKKQGSLESGEAFESYAMLYHILMDLEEFLVYKMRFIRDLDEEQKKEVLALNVAGTSFFRNGASISEMIFAISIPFWFNQKITENGGIILDNLVKLGYYK